MLVRQPIVAGQFYPSSRDACLEAINDLRPTSPPDNVPDRPVAGIVPHAGWVFSGATALRVLEAIRSRRMPEAFVLFGASHARLRQSAVFSRGRWETPLGPAEVDARLAEELLALGGDVVEDDPMPHEREHSLEVLVPLLVHVFPGARIVPVLVVPRESDAPEVGRAAARAIRALDTDAVVLGSTDLTHYGPAYRFTPKGEGEAALRWMREENDRRMLDLMRGLEAEAVVPESEAKMNACGAGAIAATLAAAKALGAEAGHVVDYTTSYDVLRARTGRADSSAAVGYAGVVF